MKPSKVPITRLDVAFFVFLQRHLNASQASRFMRGAHSTASRSGHAANQPPPQKWHLSCFEAICDKFKPRGSSLLLLRYGLLKKNKYFFFPKRWPQTSWLAAKLDFRWWRHLRRPAALAEFTAYSLICLKPQIQDSFLPYLLCTRSRFVFPFTGNKECRNWTFHFKDTLRSEQMN